MHHPTDRITHTTAFVTPVVEHWLEREIPQWVHPMKDRSDDPSHALPLSYVPLLQAQQDPWGPMDKEQCGPPNQWCHTGWGPLDLQGPWTLSTLSTRLIRPCIIVCYMTSTKNRGRFQLPVYQLYSTRWDKKNRSMDPLDGGGGVDPTTHYTVVARPSGAHGQREAFIPMVDFWVHFGLPPPPPSGPWEPLDIVHPVHPLATPLHRATLRYALLNRPCVPNDP